MQSKVEVCDTFNRFMWAYIQKSTMVQFDSKQLVMNTPTFASPKEDFNTSTSSMFSKHKSATVTSNANKVVTLTVTQSQFTLPDGLVEDARSPPELKPAELDQTGSLDDAFAMLNIVNKSCSHMQEIQTQRWLQLNEKVEHHIVNETAAIRQNEEELIWQRDYAREINRSLSRLEESNTRLGSSSRNEQELANNLNIRLNRTTTIGHLWRHIERLNIMAEEGKQRMIRVSSDIAKFSNIEKVINETKMDLLGMAGRIQSFSEGVTHNCSNNIARTTALFTSKTRQYQMKFSNVDRQFRSIKSTMQKLQSDHSSTAATLEGEIRQAVANCAAQEKNLTTTKRTVDQLKQKLSVHDSTLVRDDARIRACEINEKLLSTSLEHNKKTLKGIIMYDMPDNRDLRNFNSAQQFTFKERQMQDGYKRQTVIHIIFHKVCSSPGILLDSTAKA